MFFTVELPKKSTVVENQEVEPSCKGSLEQVKSLCKISLPDWLLSAETKNALVGITTNGLLVWYKGVWENGIWKDGTWQGGTWKFGSWHKGIWQSGDWHDGAWEDGTWKNGIWGSKNQKTAPPPNCGGHLQRALQLG